MVGFLVDAFPKTFDDRYVVHDKEVYFYKKAQLVVSELYARFGKANDSYSFSDVGSLTAFVDNVVVAMLRKYEVVLCTADLSALINSGYPIGKGSEEEVALRAAALTGVETLVQLINSRTFPENDLLSKRIDARTLCNWLWGCLGKDGSNRQYPRHLAPSTSFY